MRYRKLGRSGISVSPLCLGTYMFGGQIDRNLAARLVASGQDAGINFIDTAEAYNAGVSEETVGQVLKGRRDHWIVATKVADPIGKGPNDRGLSRRRILDAADRSLRRLGTGHIDVYYLHREDHATPLDETVRAMGDLVQQGKIRYFGVSNYRSWRIAEICHLCDANGLDRPIASQPYYNALNRMPEVELLPACAFYGLGVVPYSPLARGVLTGKYQSGVVPPPDSRAGRQDRRMMQTEWRPESLEMVQVMKRHAEARGITVDQFALAWLFNHRTVAAAIAGPRTFEQWQDYLGALDYAFTAEDEALVNELVVAGHASTPNYNDPQYPIEGRVTFTDPDPDISTGEGRWA